MKGITFVLTGIVNQSGKDLETLLALIVRIGNEGLKLDGQLHQVL
jgi:hypothetical protein